MELFKDFFKNPDKARGRSATQTRVVMTLLVRDEADVLPAFLDYHLGTGVDLILALDNDSIDGTTAILKEYEARGKLVYAYERSHDYLQDVWVTQMARRAFHEYQADWVINADADEFYIPRAGSLKDVLAGIDQGIQLLAVKRHDMAPIQRPALGPVPIEMIYRKSPSLEWVKGRPLADKLIHRGLPDVQIGRGCHTASSQYIVRQAPCPDIETLHFPIRSAEQFARKVGHVGFGLRRNHLSGSRYDDWYAQYSAGQLEKVYREYQLDPDQIREKLASGELIEDRRLADALIRLESAGPGKGPGTSMLTADKRDEKE